MRVSRGKIIQHKRRSERVQLEFSEGDKDWEKVKRSENYYKSNNNRLKNGEELKDMINSCHYFS